MHKTVFMCIHIRSLRIYVVYFILKMFLHTSEIKDVHNRSFKVHIGHIFSHNNFTLNGDYILACF